MSVAEPEQCSFCGSILDSIMSCPRCDDQSYTPPCCYCGKSIRSIQSGDVECNTCQKYICDECCNDDELGVSPNPGDYYCPECIKDPNILRL